MIKTRIISFVSLLPTFVLIWWVACSASRALAPQGNLNALLQWSRSSTAIWYPSNRKRLAQVRRFFSGSTLEVPENSRWINAGNDIQALVEADEHRGDGVVFVRLNDATPLIIQTPHRFFDRHTMILGRDLFQETNARAFLINSVHRYRGANCAVGTRNCKSDLAHSRQTVFHAAHQGLLERYPQSRVVAIHGFHRTAELPDVIVSGAGTNTPLECILESLSALELRVARYPETIDRLGGELCIQAEDLRRRGGAMVHLELGHELRDSMARNRRVRQRFIQTLARCL